MNVLWYYVIGFIVEWILEFLLKDKFNITMEGIVLMLKTERLKGVLDRIANRCPRLWKAYLNIGMPIGIFFLILMVITLIWSLQLMFKTPTVSLILPGVDIPGSPIYIPFTTGLVALATVLVIHEGGHGILARVEGISIDSVGLLLLAIIPGAFVEPNPDELERANGISKLRVYFAGPMFNLGLCLIALVITAGIGGFLASENIYTTDGMEISSVVAGSPSQSILSEGMVIHKINGDVVTNTSSYTRALSGMHIGDNLSITTDTGTYNITASQSPNNSSKSYIGIRAKQHEIIEPVAKKKYGTLLPLVLSKLEEIFYLIFFLNFAVGTFNLLPMKPLDGGLILEEILKMKIRPDRRLEFNQTLNKYTKFLPGCIRCWISRRFNWILNFISHHELNDNTVEHITRYISSLFIVILVVLIIYGMVPGILKMF